MLTYINIVYEKQINLNATGQVCTSFFSFSRKTKILFLGVFGSLESMFANDSKFL